MESRIEKGKSILFRIRPQDRFGYYTLATDFTKSHIPFVSIEPGQIHELCQVLSFCVDTDPPVRMFVAGIEKGG